MKRRTYESEEGWLLSYADLLTNLVIYFAVIMGAAQMSRSQMQEISQELSGVEQPESLSSIQRQVEERIAEEGLGDDISAQVADDGLRLSLNSGIVFDAGSGAIRGAHEHMLDSMLEILVPYADHYAFAVEGHTDSMPFGGAVGRTNWDLSSERAIAVRQRLEGVGIDPGRIRVEGYADTVPLPENELVGLTATERHARHRRVVVRVF
jgi:chemotaxis protein MotB